MTRAAAIPVGEHLYDADMQFTRFSDYGVRLQDLNSGRVIPPPAGARIDLAFEGTIDGPNLKGTIVGVDYIVVRADGRFQLNIQATITTDDGATIAVAADGVAMPSGGVLVPLRKNVQMTTAAPKYAWVNQLQIWVRGSADMSAGRLRWMAFVA
jgi:hypothetical protein